ncbi:MAG: 4-hydroxy-tetrahydrodipicolinate reductase [Cyanobacteria bacterium SZAS LIN-3]|nr:4-hydroxy-tetrahydrodipicolinate reductase [Cyanobacteria bacterium SZAS LIN-3]MBS2009239.1 4-hydroxy-tetrahydrodipicolinate reductase [Cyanobacteria bacterium SZAS TMP-1]
MAKIRVAIAGINGRMGRASLNALLADSELEVVGAFGRADADYVGKDLSAFAATPTDKKVGVVVSSSFEDMLSSLQNAGQAKPDVLLDNMVASASFESAKKALAAGIRPVVGTSGLKPEMVAELSRLASEKSTGAMIVPNFSIGAVLMMEFARQAAKYFGNVEVVEMHGPKKIDAPSGTAMHTLNKIASAGGPFNPKLVEEHELIPHARGGLHESGVRVHSLRMPGMISHQDVLFAGDGEMLCVRHDSFTTNCFLKGILLSIKSVMNLSELRVGLETIL